MQNAAFGLHQYSQLGAGPVRVFAECEKGTCNFKDETPHQLEICRIKGLPDLNQTVPYVAETLLKWMSWIRDEYQIDGFRVDAAKHMPAVSQQGW